MSDTFFEFSSVISLSESVASKASSTGLLILVSGGNRGIGLKIVHRLVETLASSSKSTILVTSRSLKQAERAIEELKVTLATAGTEVKVNLVPQALDIGDEASVDALRETIENDYHNRLDILINNAGIAYTMSDTTPFPEQARHTIEVNYNGTKRMMLALLPALRNSELSDGGRVVNVSSSSGVLTGSNVSEEIQQKLLSDNATVADVDAVMSGFVAAAAAGTCKGEGYWGSAYAASKSGVTQLTRVLAAEEAALSLSQPERRGRSVRLFSCCPGLCRTDMTNRSTPSALSMVFWAATWVIGHSAYAGADTPTWLAVGDVSLRDSKEGRGVDLVDLNGKFVAGRQVKNY